MSRIIPDGKLIADDSGHYRLIYYPEGIYAGHVIGWPRIFSEENQPRPLEDWKSTDFGSPLNAIKSYPRLRKKLLQAATGEL